MDHQPIAEDYQQIISQKDREIRKLERQLRNRDETDARAAIYAASKKRVDTLILLERKRQEKFMRLLLSNSPDMILLLDQTGRIAYCTDSFLRRIKIDSFEMINGNYYIDVFEKYGLAEWADQFNQLFDAFESNDRSSTFTIFSNEDEHQRQYQVHFAPAINDKGEPDGSIILMHDVTALIKAKKQAEEASVSKTNFLSNMSHEIRTPINAIIGMSRIAKNTQEINRVQYCIDKIDTASSHLLGIINDILDMSKIESGKFDLSPTIFDVEKMLMKISSVHAFRMDERHQKFFVSIAPEIPRLIKSDEQRIAQVITNLISNAIKFTPEFGSIKLLVEQSQETDTQIQLKIAICDTGIGISDEKRNKLFQSFEQGDSGVSRKYGGTGLGLVISKNIVAMMNGEIWVESEAGKGSDFIFTIWVDKCNDSEMSLTDELAEAVADDLRLLVVDDSKDTLRQFALLVKSKNEKAQCDTASSGEEAMAYIAKAATPYSLIFVGWTLPDMDGAALIEKMKKTSVDSEIVVMTATSDREIAEAKAGGLGVTQFLPKPLFASNLAACIRVAWHGGGAEAEAENGKEVSNKDIFVGYKLLLVEDVEINREIAMALLEETGIQIVCAEDGEIACATFAAKPDSFDLILMDLQMPVVDGLEATRRIRAMDLEKAKAIPIVAMTANVFKEDIDLCIQSGMNSHLGKPINIDELIATLKHYLQVG